LFGIDRRARVVATRTPRRQSLGGGHCRAFAREIAEDHDDGRLAARLIDACTVSISHPAPPSALAVSASGPVDTNTLQRVAVVIIASHAVLLGVVQWLLFEQFLERTVPDAAQAVAAAFRQYTLRVFGAEVAALAAAAAAVVVARLLLGRVGNSRRIAAAGVIAYAPITLWSMGVLLALAMGWQPDVWLMSAADARAPEIAATVREALPIVLQPLLLGRHMATVVAAIAFAILQWRLCRVSASHAAMMGTAAGVAAIAAQVLMLGVPMTE
jgi:hypothetical protein